MFKLLIIARSGSGSYQGGVAMTSQIVEFNSQDAAETAVKAVQNSSKHIADDLLSDITVVRLYTQGG